MRNEPYRDTLYLDEIKDHDIDNLKSLFLKMPVRRFNSREKVRGFFEYTFQKTLKKLGVREWTTKEDLDNALKESNVRLERRLNYQGPDEWRKGTYLYKNGEIVMFFSEPRKVSERQQNGIVIIGETEWLVKTNGEV